MTTVQINLPDELAQKAASAGLLSAEAMEWLGCCGRGRLGACHPFRMCR